MPSEREHFDLDWMASAAFWTRARQLSDRGWEARGYPEAVILLKYYEASDTAEKKKRALERKHEKSSLFVGKYTSQGSASDVVTCFSRTPQSRSTAA